MSPRFEVALLAYRDGGPESAWGGKLQGREAVPITEIVSSPLRIETFQDEVETKSGGTRMDEWEQPIWIEAIATSEARAKTPPARVCQLVSDFIGAHPTSFPPIVVHILGGTVGDGDWLKEAAAVHELGTTDGQVLFIHVGFTANPGPRVIFPVSTQELPPGCELALHMFETATRMPPELVQFASMADQPVRSGNRMMCINPGAHDLLRLLPPLWRISRPLLPR